MHWVQLEYTISLLTGNLFLLLQDTKCDVTRVTVTTTWPLRPHRLGLKGLHIHIHFPETVRNILSETECHHYLSLSTLCFSSSLPLIFSTLSFRAHTVYINIISCRGEVK